jgi:hypothetical protein
MRTEALPILGGLKAHRRFEISRLAEDCQARAYEQILLAATPTSLGRRREIRRRGIR